MLCVLGGVFTRVPGPGYMTYVCRQLLILTDSVTVGGGWRVERNISIPTPR